MKLIEEQKVIVVESYFFFIAGMRMLLEWARAMASFALKPKMRRDHNILVYFKIKNITWQWKYWEKGKQY